VKRAAALFLVLASAKGILFLLRALDGCSMSLLGAIAMLRDEALVALVCAAIEKRSERLIQILYWPLCLYAAFNVPVARVLGTPLTASLMGAAGGALSDSIRVYVTPTNVGAVLVVTLMAHVASKMRAAYALVIAAACALLPLDVDTLGLHRDPAVTLVSTLWKRARTTTEPVKDLPVLDAEGAGIDLSHLAGAARGRHVVWIVLESTGARYLPSYGSADDPMPNLSRLVERSIVFENAYAVYPESIKGLYATLCSIAPAPHTTADRYAADKVPCTSAAEAFDRSALFHSGHFGYLGMNHIVRGRGFTRLADAKDIGGKHFSSFGVDDASTARAALRWMDERKPGERLMLLYMPISGHHPYETPGEGARPFGEETDLQRYKSDLFRGDLALGELIDGLKARGLEGETLFVIHGDHGEAFAQHEGNFAHSLYLYEENVRVPLFVVAPGIVTSPIRAPQLVTLLDVVPTLADLAGLPPSPLWEGRSALPGEGRVARFFADHTMTWLGLRDGPWKLIHDADSGRSRLFDLSADPEEKLDLASREHARVARYEEHLGSWSQRQRAIATRSP
jgi:hypothetical protein